MTSPPTNLGLTCRCGYDLRGLSDDANCPECGRPVAEAIKQKADPPRRFLVIAFLPSLLVCLSMLTPRGSFGEPRTGIGVLLFFVGLFLMATISPLAVVHHLKSRYTYNDRFTLFTNVLGALIGIYTVSAFAIGLCFLMPPLGHEG